MLQSWCGLFCISWGILASPAPFQAQFANPCSISSLPHFPPTPVLDLSAVAVALPVLSESYALPADVLGLALPQSLATVHWWNMHSVSAGPWNYFRCCKTNFNMHWTECKCIFSVLCLYATDDHLLQTEVLLIQLQWTGNLLSKHTF